MFLMLLIETDVHFVSKTVGRRGTSLCSKSALMWGHAQIAAQLRARPKVLFHTRVQEQFKEPHSVEKGQDSSVTL